MPRARNIRAKNALGKKYGDTECSKQKWEILVYVCKVGLVFYFLNTTGWMEVFD